ncbi:tyrosine-protein kinase BAZ1B-like [Anneissia japonica]|uniref:tyrosine-protein kinase BAZ1B-like n=1 Tax=Anneissia japonica TaxID=1529436 RepID=UPI0014256209|nr:tyrosine-protein kinase BAZ1B-like [Anneissia japonica]
MPLLDHKPYILAKKPKDLYAWDKQYTIPVTGEVFRTQDDYIKKLALYSSRNWTCRCTGKSNLTFREALDSERTAEEALQDLFPTHFEKIACELSHHSPLSLDHLTEQIVDKISQTFVVGELVELKVKVKSKVIRGKILKVEEVSNHIKIGKQTGSPSSDKENFTGDRLQSPSKVGNILCNIKLIGEEKIIGSVPAKELVRLEEVPSKDIIQLFLKAYTIQSDCQNKSLWVVSEQLVKKYGLVNKFPEYLLSPYKVQFESPRRRRSESIDSPSKKTRTPKSKGQTDLFAYYSKEEHSPQASASCTSPIPVYLDHTYSSPASKNKLKFQFDQSGDEQICRTSGEKSQIDSKSKIKSSSKEIVKIPKMPSKESTLRVNLFCRGNEDQTVNVVDTGSSSSSMSDSDDDVPLQKLVHSPASLKKKLANKTEIPSSDEDVPLIQISRDEIKSNWKKVFKKMSAEKAKLDKSKSEKKNSSKKKSKKSKESEKKKKKDKSKKSTLKSSSKKTTPTKVSTKKKSATPVKMSKTKSKNTPKKTPSKSSLKSKLSKGNTPKKSSKSPKNKKSMKQMTLFDIGRKKSSHDSSDDSDGRYQIVKQPPKSPRPRTPKMPAIVQKLISAKKSNKRPQYIHYLSLCARQLTTIQRNHLNPLVKEEVARKHEQIQKKLKWKAMSEEEKKAYLKAQRVEKSKVLKEAKHKRIEEAKRQRIELAKRYEDQELILKPLIMPKPVELPEGLPNTRFGDIAMVAEFLNMYSGLLMPDDPYPITAENLILALVSGAQGFGYLSRCLVILLKTLLQDDIAEDYSELGMKLSGIPVNMHTATELMRLCLRPNDQETDDSDSDEEIHQDVDNDVPQHLVEKLETKEFYELDPDEKIVLLICLCHRIMSSYSVIDFMEDKQREATKLWKEKLKILKEKNDKVKEEKKKIKEQKEALQVQKEEEEKKKETATNNGEKIQAKKEVKKTEKVKEEKEEEIVIPEDDNDLISVIKRRRLQSAKMKAERAEQERKEKERRIKDQEELKKQKEAESFEKKFEEGIQLAKSILRSQPLGVDRNHSRYWLFSSVVPGLFVEKGWASKDIGKSFKEDDNESDTDSDDSDLPTEGIELTIPKVGQNMWFQYESQKDLDTLIEVMNNQGIRESNLYTVLKKNYQDIVKSINTSRRSSPGLRACNGPEDLLAAFKEDLLDEELHIRQGNLGGVESFQVWEKSLQTAEDLETLGRLLIETQSSTNPKFLQGVMAMKKHKVRVEENDEDDGDADKPEVTEKVLKWREAVENPTTLSRLHVLLGIFESSVKWEKSAENAKCKICRKKGNDDRLLLCDECNQPFHLLCLRPALKAVPKGEWKCPSCKPQTPRRTARNRVIYEDDDDDDDDDSDGEEEEHYCLVCEEQGELLNCSECESFYHRDCHEPPLRNFPRGKWVCSDCTSGGRRRTKSKRARNAAKKKAKKPAPASRKRIRYEDDDDSDQQVVTTTKRAKQVFETRILEDILYRLKKSKDSTPFRKPIDKKEAKQYYKVVKNPVDLQTIQTRTLCLEYNNYDSFIADIKLIFSNAELYYEEGSEEVMQSERLEKLFIETLQRLIPNAVYSRTSKGQESSSDSDKNHNTRKRRKVCL